MNPSILTAFLDTTNPDKIEYNELNTYPRYLTPCHCDHCFIVQLFLPRLFLAFPFHQESTERCDTFTMTPYKLNQPFVDKQTN